jgi:hypothetical protein
MRNAKKLIPNTSLFYLQYWGILLHERIHNKPSLFSLDTTSPLQTVIREVESTTSQDILFSTP